VVRDQRREHRPVTVEHGHQRLAVLLRGFERVQDLLALVDRLLRLDELRPLRHRPIGVVGLVERRARRLDALLGLHRLAAKLVDPLTRDAKLVAGRTRRECRHVALLGPICT